MTDWFTANKDGLWQIAERLVERRGFGVIAGELYQNVMDTNATKCSIEIEKLPGRPVARLVVEDNDPTGFVDLSHAWTMFAPSLKKKDPTKAGRFNMGEKMVLSFCRDAAIFTTSGMVSFSEKGRKDYPRKKRDVGTVFDAIINCTQERFEQFVEYCYSILVRPGLELTVNGNIIKPRTPIKTFMEKMTTEVAGEDGILRKTVRTCEIQIFEPNQSEVACLYEMGIPVVETGDKYHVNIMQKVPLNVDRDNVTPAFLRDVRVAVYNHMFNQISEEDTTSTWVNEAAESPNCTPEAVTTFRVKKYGERSVAFDPTNAEANAEAVANGYTVIPSRGLTTGQRENLYAAGSLKTSSQQFPTAGRGAYSDDPNAIPVDVLSDSQLSAGMRKMREYTIGVAQRILGKSIEVRFVQCSAVASMGWRACYGRGHSVSGFDYNVTVLGRKYFEGPITVDQDSLIIHELAHEYESNHLCDAYYRACTKLGATLKKAVMEDLDWFKQF